MICVLSSEFRSGAVVNPAQLFSTGGHRADLRHGRLRDAKARRSTRCVLLGVDRVECLEQVQGLIEKLAEAVSQRAQRNACRLREPCDGERFAEMPACVQQRNPRAIECGDLVGWA